jgi:hypothetical protein
MLRFCQLTKCATIAVSIAALGTSAAQARPADVPLHPGSLARGAAAGSSATTPRASSWTPPRVEGMGIRPTTSAPSPAPAVSLAQPVAESGFDWLSAVIGASALFALALLLAVMRSMLPRRHHIAPPSA